MAKTKQPSSSSSAAARRAQERQQRQRRDETRVATRNVQGPRPGPRVHKKDRSNLYMVVGVLILFAAIVGAILWIKNQPVSQTNTNSALKPTPADTAVVQKLTTVPQSTLQTIGDGGLKNPFQVYKGQPALTGPNGHPEFLYIGGQYCPHCAAERWAMINALSRFGTFSNLESIVSYEYSISTFSFPDNSYTSQYIDFVPVEVYGNQLNHDGTGYVPLKDMTSDQQQNFNKYNSSQSFPFMNINNQYVGVGATYAFTTLMDSNQTTGLSWQTIASSLSDTKSPIAKGILGSANYLTAAICQVTNQQPGNVCNAPEIQQLSQKLSQTSLVPGSSANPLALSLAPADLPVVQRRVLD